MSIGSFGASARATTLPAVAAGLCDIAIPRTTLPKCRAPYTASVIVQRVRRGRARLSGGKGGMLGSMLLRSPTPHPLPPAFAGPCLRALPKWARTGVAVCAAALLVLTASSWAHAQVPPMSSGPRQPKATDVPKDSSKKETPPSPEDVALERALKNICRGCSPIIPVRDVPRYDLARSCPAGQNSETCVKDEETVRGRLKEQWGQFTAQARSDCVQRNDIGGNPNYTQLIICLKATQIAPTLPEGR